MRLVEAPKLRFRCACGALNEGESHEFHERNTMPPSFLATCAFCSCTSVVFPTALVARSAGAQGPQS